MFLASVAYPLSTSRQAMCAVLNALTIDGRVLEQLLCECPHPRKRQASAEFVMSLLRPVVYFELRQENLLERQKVELKGADGTVVTGEVCHHVHAVCSCNPWCVFMRGVECPRRVCSMFAPIPSLIRLRPSLSSLSYQFFVFYVIRLLNHLLELLKRKNRHHKFSQVFGLLRTLYDLGRHNDTRLLIDLLFYFGVSAEGANRMHLRRNRLGRRVRSVCKRACVCV